MLDYQALEAIANTLTPAGNFSTVETEPAFAKKVRLASVLLRANSPISYTDIRTMTQGVYYKIALRIASARFVNNTTNFQWTEADILAMMTPYGAASLSSPITRLGSFSGGIEFAAAQLSASYLIRNIPLNSTLKFNDMAETLEKSAWEDVDRIIQIINTSSNSDNSITEDTNKKGQAFLYIAHSLDLTTIPETFFNAPDKDSNPSTFLLPVDLNDPDLIPPAQIEVVNTLSVPVDHVGICYFYMTGQAFTADQDIITTRVYGSLEGSPQNSKSVSYKIEKAFKILDPNEIVNIDDIISQVADEINTETLSITDTHVANILTAPDRGANRSTTETVTKRDLYPNTTALKNRRATFSLYHRINKLSFDVRRYSSKAETEMLTIAFYTVPLANWTTYTADPSTLLDLKKSGTLGIEGLIFGTQNSYSSLNNNVPYSALLNVEKGNLAVVSIASDTAGGGLNPTDNLANSDASNTIDTLYFAYDDPLITTPTTAPFTTNLKLRLSSTSYLQSALATSPIDITVDLIPPFKNPYDNTIVGSVPLERISIGEQIAERVVDAIYNFTKTSNEIQGKDSSNVLGVLLGDYQRITTVVNSTLGTANEIPLERFIDNTDQVIEGNFATVQELTSVQKDNIAGRVQIVAFRYRNEEYRIILELLEVPENLWVGTGNYILRRTQWALGRRRSITIETKILNNAGTIVETTSEELNSVKASVSKVEASKSKLLQGVYDKRTQLEDIKKGIIHKCRNQI